MLNIKPPAPFHVAADSTIVDARTLLYRPADRTMVIQEQVALFAARQALARWRSGADEPIPGPSSHGLPYRAAWFDRAQRDFVSWIERGGVWETDHVDA